MFWANTRQFLGDMECSWHSMNVRLYNVSQWAVLGSGKYKKGDPVRDVPKRFGKYYFGVIFFLGGWKESSKIHILCNPSNL